MPLTLSCGTVMANTPHALGQCCSMLLVKFALLGCKMRGRDGPPAFHQDLPVLPGSWELV